MFGLSVVGKEKKAAEDVCSVVTYLETVASFRAGRDGQLWFRGMANKAYKLSPSLFRCSKYKNTDSVNSVEKKIYEEFYFRYSSYSGFLSRDSWDLIFLMQHYGVPTRLLDWTESPLIALFFALESPAAKDACVWLFDPADWNRGILQDIGEHRKIFSTSDDFLDQYHPEKRSDTARSEPVAIHGMVNNARINAQKGKFVLFGQKIEDLEKFSKSRKEKWVNTPLDKVVIPKHAIEAMRRELTDMGVTHTTIYPDLEGLAAEIKQRWGFV